MHCTAAPGHGSDSGDEWQALVARMQASGFRWGLCPRLLCMAPQHAGVLRVLVAEALHAAAGAAGSGGEAGAGGKA